MTGKKQKLEPLDVHKALNILYGDGGRDLTSEGYIEAMHQLRLKDEAQARRVERTLAPILKERIFRRKQVEWYNTSEGTRIRLLLLPDNPHVQADAVTIRQVLGIPNGHVNVTEKDPLWQQLKASIKLEEIRRVAEGNLAGWWLHVHMKVASGQKTDGTDKAVLSSDLLESAAASATKDLRSKDIPDWMRQSANKSTSRFNLLAPLEYCASRLAERYHLPPQSVRSLNFYILTQDPSWITGIDPVVVDIKYTDEPGGHDKFDVCLKGVNEFMTEKDWQHVWIEYVRPRQQRLWAQRGMKPQGRRTVDFRRLKKALPLYLQMVKGNIEINELLSQPIEDLSLVDLDQETIRAAIHDLERVLAPK